MTVTIPPEITLEVVSTELVRRINVLQLEVDCNREKLAGMEKCLCDLGFRFK